MQSTVFDLGFVRRLKDIDTLVVHYSIYVYIECHTGQYKKIQSNTDPRLTKSIEYV